MIFLLDAILANVLSRSSGTLTRPMFGLMVQKGKFAASAFCVFVRALNSVDFPTLGIPTRPQDRDPPLKEASHALIENDRAEVARHKFRAILAAMVKPAAPGQVNKSHKPSMHV